MPCAKDKTEPAAPVENTSKNKVKWWTSGDDRCKIYYQYIKPTSTSQTVTGTPAEFNDFLIRRKNINTDIEVTPPFDLVNFSECK